MARCMLAATAIFAVVSAHDTTTLLQHTATWKSDWSDFHFGYNTRDGDVCNCRSWKEVYESKSASCDLNSGFEFSFLSTAQKMTMQKYMTKTYCKHFHELIKGNFCLSKKFNSATRSQWCYVSPECKKLNGGNKVSSKAAWKNCLGPQQNGTDFLSNEWTPEEMNAVTYQEGIPLDMLTKYAYPASGQRWDDVAYFFTPKDASAPKRSPLRMLFSLGSGGKKKLQEIRDSGRPTLFDSSTGMPPYHVVMGPKVYIVEYTKWKWENEEHDENDNPRLWAHPGWLSKVRCLAGCEEPPAPQQ